MAYREAAGCSANNRMEVSARKLPLIPPTRLGPGYSKESLVSVTMNNVNPRPRLFFGGQISRLPPGATRSFSPAVEDTIRLWPTSFIPSHSGRWKQLRQRSSRASGSKREQGPPIVCFCVLARYSVWVYRSLSPCWETERLFC